jgi:hypothetical protein
MKRTMIRLSLLGLVWGLSASIGAAQDVQSMLARIKAVGKEGAGNVEAARAWKELVAQGPAVMPVILAGMDDANPVAVNWLRGAVEAIQDKAVGNSVKIPADKLEAFLKDTKHAHHSRRLAYECLVKLDPSTPKRWLPNLLDDPSPELRRDAVAAKLKEKRSFVLPEDHRDHYLAMLKHARDRDQVNEICDVLKKEHKIDIDLTKHFGFVTRWNLVGPFDNVKGVGFNNVYPPEKGVDVKASYVGKEGDKVRWQEHVTKKDLGLVDLAEAIGKLKGAVFFAHTVVESAAERPVEIRAASNNAVRIWLNGKEIYFREEYHHGMKMDQHVGKGTLRAGRNEILIKVCQNEQTESWAQEWSFQLRVCDHLGAAVPITDVTESVK